MSKRITLLFLIIFLSGLFFPLVSLAGFYPAGDSEVCYDGLVPCGKNVCIKAGFNSEVCRAMLKDVQDRMKADPNLGPVDAFKKSCAAKGGESKEIRCQFCHFFVMIDGILDFLFIFIVPPIGALMLAVGGIMFFFAGGNPQLMGQARSLIKYTVLGLVVIYGAYLIVGTVLTMVEVQEWTTLDTWLSQGAFNINCPIELPSP